MKKAVIRKERVVLPDGVRLSDRVSKEAGVKILQVLASDGKEEAKK